MCVLAYKGAGVVSDEGLGWSVIGGSRCGAEGQIKGSGRDRRAIDDDDRRRFERAEKSEEARLR